MAHHITETIGAMYEEGSPDSKYDPQQKELPPLPGDDENATTTEGDVETENKAERRNSRRASRRVSFRKSFSNESAADSAAAAAVVQQEMNNVQTLKRLSMGALSTIDPDLPQMFWLDDSAGSPSSSSSSSTPPGGESSSGNNEASLSPPPTSPPPVPPKSPTDGDRSESGENNDGSSPINASHASQLLWVPAHVHPEIAPQEWKSFVQNKVAEIKANVSSSPNSGSDSEHSGSLNRRNSRLSLEISNQDEYRDGSEILQRRTSQDSTQSISRLSAQLQTLGELESLAMDPFQLARSLSHSPVSSQPPPPSHSSENERPQSTPELPANAAQPLANDADEPILAAPSSSLRRSTRTRYSKSSLRRGGRRLRLDTERASKEDVDGEDGSGMPRSRTSPELSRPLQDFSVTDEQEHRPLRKASLDDDYPLRVEPKVEEEEPQEQRQKQELPPPSKDEQPDPESQKEPPSLKEKAQVKDKEDSSERKKSKRRQKEKQLEINTSIPSTTTIASIPPVPSTAPPPPPASPPPTAPPPPPPSSSQQKQQAVPPGNKGASAVAKPTSPSLQVQPQQPTAPAPQQPATKQNKTKPKKGTWGWLFSDKSKDSNEPTTNKSNTNANTNEINGVPDTHDKVTVDKLLNRNATDDDSDGSNNSGASSPSKATFSSLFTKKKNKKEPSDADSSDSKRKKKNKKPKSKKSASRYRTRQQLEGDDDFDEEEEEDIGGELVGGVDGLPQNEHDMRQLQYEQQIQQQQQQEIQLPYNIPPHQVSDKSMVMLYHRYPLHIERAIYRLSHLKLANPRRPLAQQVLLSNFMYAYLNLINHGYQQQQQLQQLQMQEEMSEMQVYQGQEQQDYEHEYEYDMETEGQQPFDPYASEHQTSAYDGHFGAQSPSAESSSSSSSSGGGSNYEDMWHGEEQDDAFFDDSDQAHKKSYHRDPVYGVA